MRLARRRFLAGERDRGGGGGSLGEKAAAGKAHASTRERGLRLPALGVQAKDEQPEAERDFRQAGGHQDGEEIGGEAGGEKLGKAVDQVASALDGQKDTQNARQKRGAENEPAEREAVEAKKHQSHGEA